MWRAALIVPMVLGSGAVLAHSGHGGSLWHWHGIEVPLLLLAAVMLGVLLTRR